MVWHKWAEFLGRARRRGRLERATMGREASNLDTRAVDDRAARAER